MFPGDRESLIEDGLEDGRGASPLQEQREVSRRISRNPGRSLEI